MTFLLQLDKLFHKCAFLEPFERNTCLEPIRCVYTGHDAKIGKFSGGRFRHLFKISPSYNSSATLST